MDDTEIFLLVNDALNVPLDLTTTICKIFILTGIWKTPTLHTDTNLSPLLFSVALSDLGVGLISQHLRVPFTLYQSFRGYGIMGKTVFSDVFWVPRPRMVTHDYSDQCVKVPCL